MGYQHNQQHGCISKVLHSMKEALHSRAHNVKFHVYAVLTGKHNGWWKKVRTVAASGGWGGNCLERGTRELSGMMLMFYSLTGA